MGVYRHFGAATEEFLCILSGSAAHAPATSKAAVPTPPHPSVKYFTVAPAE